MAFEETLYDAFVGVGLKGNPAAVCLLEDWPEDSLLQSEAARIGVSDTAYLVAKKGHYELRWFTPALEIDLCGHATLAAAHWHFQDHKGRGDIVRFETRKAGTLTVARSGAALSMDFPSRPPLLSMGGRTGEIVEALGTRPLEIQETERDYLCLLDSEARLRALKPDMDKLRSLDKLGVIVTALPSETRCDFLSRFFAPRAGIPEDPVTGSAHCVLAPYWAGHLKRARFHAIQASERGGEIFCKVQGDRVLLSGRVEARV